MDKEKIDSLITVAKDYGFVTLSCDDFLQLVRERDAACGDLTILKKGNECRICMHRFNFKICEHCSYFDSKFEWRGIDGTIH